jgi:methylenetetrahydrofolate--tRNA-(uracil-5-)-methyltransferase
MAGQLTGVEGYVESMASGMAAGIYASLHFLEAEDDFKFPECTMIGALAKYISSANRNFQPMNSNFGIIPPVTGSERMQKYDRYSAYAMRSLDNIRNVKNCLKLFIH